jgi:long-chain acyl-CoA synthetase
MRTHRHDLINIMSCTIELGVRRDDRALLLFPFYHVMFPDHLRHILMSNVMVIRREGGFEPREVLDMLSAERITMCQFVPTMVNALLQVDSPERYDLSSFRSLIYAGSPMPVELIKKAMQRFQCQFFQLYGQTETGPCTTALRPEEHVLEGSAAQIARLASAGRAVVDYEVRIVHEDGSDVDVGEIGEIIVRSEAMTVGYWGLPEETAKTIRYGWLYTGDFGTFDDENYVFIVDRKHDMIISGGKNIYPREIEEVIYSHEAVLEAAVIGVPDDYWGESVKAFVVLKDGMTATEEEIINLCKESIASYKKPRSVEFVEGLPKNPTGKILKRVIREHYWKGRERRV